jgi:hypothetical protein
MEYRYTLRNLNNLHSLSHFLSDLHDNANVSNEIRALARDILGDYAIGLRTTNDGFIVEERNRWVEIMKRFYRILQDPHYNCSNAEIRVTHPGPIGIWSNWDEIQDTLTAQRDLVNGKNVTIRRVFVGTEDISPDLDDNSTHAKVINDMSEYKILRYYVKRQNPGMIRDVTWIPDLGFFTEWFVRPGGSVEEIKIRSDATERRELETMWQGLMNDIGSGRGFEAQNNAEIARDLAAKRSASLSLVA